MRESSLLSDTSIKSPKHPLLMLANLSNFQCIGIENKFRMEKVEISEIQDSTKKQQILIERGSKIMVIQSFFRSLVHNVIAKS